MSRADVVALGHPMEGGLDFVAGKAHALDLARDRDDILCRGTPLG